MTTLALQAVADQLKATLALSSVAANADHFSKVSTDTRSIQPGDLFVALRGERFDAHNFLEDAVRQRASALVVEKHFAEFAVPQLIVKDTTWALGQIAKINRQLFTGPVIGVTGSCGKTTVKTLIHNILATNSNVLATEGSLNNHIGVPLTLFRLEPSHQFAVIEMGASAAGEIDYLAKLALPDVAVITNAMLAHVEGFGSLQGIARAKGEIYQNLSAGGVAVLNWNDAQKDVWLQNIGQRKVVRFAVNNNDVQELQELKQQAVEFVATDLVEQTDGTVAFQLLTPDGCIDIRLQLLGKHNVANAVAAAACAHSVGIDIEAIKEGLEQSRAVSGRMQAHTGINGAMVIDDSYNANPGSVKAAIDSLVRWQGNSVLVLGDLGELGADSQAMHDELGRYAKAAGIKHIFATGQFTRGTCHHFGNGAEHFADHQAIVQRLKVMLDRDTMVLVKGSRSAHMELVVTEIVAR